MKVAILMPWVGGPVPPHLGYTCASMLGGAKTSTLLLFHELAAANSIPEACQVASNVELVRFANGGVAALHARRLGAQLGLEDHEALTARFERLFVVAPGTLAEFKPAWGFVFQGYLEGFTHWTYTDVDVTFGHLDAWLGFRQERDRFDVDIETWSFEGDAGRLFLRGQWALHRRDPHLELLWTSCAHLSSKLMENLDYKLRYYGHAKSVEFKRRVLLIRRMIST